MSVPPAPPLSTPAAKPNVSSEPQEEPDENSTTEATDIPADRKPMSTETGLASWYGPPYHNRRASNGEVYNMHAMTAAHRTLPLGSIVRVTNVKTGSSAVVRITDRGPFIEGRIIDLSLAAAKATDVWKAGIAQVRLDVLKTPTPLATGGRWATR